MLDDDLQTDTMTVLAEPETIAEPLPAVADPSGSTMIVFEGVEKIYEPNVTALNGVSFTIEERTDLGRVRAERAREATAFNASMWDSSSSGPHSGRSSCPLQLARRQLRGGAPDTFPLVRRALRARLV